jgi:exodeoxyribonuclease VII small subunit
MTRMSKSHNDPESPQPTAAAQPAEAAQPASFEEALSQLGDLVAKLESGSLGLSESIDAYERGVTILRRLHDELAHAEERVSMLVGIDEEGRPVLAPHEPAETAPASAQPATRRASRPRSGRTRSLPGMDEVSDGA